MKSAVIFCPKIDYSKHLQEIFPEVQKNYRNDLSPLQQKKLIEIEFEHVDGTTPANERSKKIQKLRETEGNKCKVLSNVRCLSEGVDVPSLDAVIFLSSKKSKIDIIQAVGRALRKPKNSSKKYGYIVVPMIISNDQDAEIETNRNEKYRPIVEIINALASHDEAMNIEIERIRQTGESDIIDEGASPESQKNSGADFKNNIHEQISLDLDAERAELFAHIISVVGDNLYWYRWADKVAKIVERHKKRITDLISVEGEPKRIFKKFLNGLKKSLGTSVDEIQAVDMLAQHLVTKPVFEALFENYSFAKKNPVSRAMHQILKELDKDGISKERDDLKDFEDSVRDHCKKMGDAKNRQDIIIKLYDSFFKIALPKTSTKLGIVYTPVEVVDFILNSVNDVLQKNFKKALSDKNIHILDPFTGTGTFIVRLIQSGLIDKKDLHRKFFGDIPEKNSKVDLIKRKKYFSEVHANEIVLLAYYIAAINIENALNAATNAENYQPFGGIYFTDTFQMTEKVENSPRLFEIDMLNKNAERIKEQLDTKIEIIIGNPPYSVGQKSANDNNQNTKYRKLEEKIKLAFSKTSSATSTKAVHDSYIKAFFWAMERIGDSGIIGFITNSGWIDSVGMDGMRNYFENEFSEIYIFNLRGDIHGKSGDEAKKAGKGGLCLI